MKRKEVVACKYRDFLGYVDDVLNGFTEEDQKVTDEMYKLIRELPEENPDYVFMDRTLYRSLNRGNEAKVKRIERNRV